MWLFIVYCWLFTWSYGNWWILSLNLGVFLLSLFFRTINTTSSRIRGRERDISNSKISSAVKTMYWIFESVSLSLIPDGCYCIIELQNIERCPFWPNFVLFTLRYLELVLYVNNEYFETYEIILFFINL